MGLLRLLLALSVVSVHSTPIPLLPRIGPEDAVRSFFAISGFYMALVLNEKYPSTREGNWAFAKNRLLRLYPTYAILAAGSLLDKVIARNHFDLIPVSTKTFVLVALANLTMLGQDALTFMGVDARTGDLYATRFFREAPNPAYRLLLLPPAWSLSVELLLYALAPFVVRRGWKVVGSLAGLSFALRLAGDRLLGLNSDPWTYRFLPFEIGTFLLGSLAYFAFARLRERFRSRVPLGATYALVFMALAGAALVPVAGTVLATVTVTLPLLFTLTKDSRFDRFVGDLSYPVYLSHWLVILALNFVHVRGGLPVAVVSILLSALLARFVDTPLDRFRQRLAERHGARRISEVGNVGEPLAEAK